MTLEIPLPGSIDGFGSGCAGSAGTPTLVPDPGATARAGRTLSMTLRNLPSGGVAFYSLGTSAIAWHSMPLPFDLGGNRRSWL